MEYESIDVTAETGRARWRQAGEPLVPSLVVDGVSMPILHRSQLASLLDLPVTSTGEARRVAGDTVSILTAWTALIEPLEWDLLTKPTPSRSRSIRNLTVNVFHPFELLPTAWGAGRFEWDPDRDDEREALIASSAELYDYASSIAQTWTAALLEIDTSLEAHDPLVGSPRGEIAFSSLLEQQRWHAAFHFRQIVEFLASNGHAPATLDVNGFRGLALPSEVY